jgi:hypothetical protein
MPALRVCAWGAELEVAGDALFCTGCGARARAWLVLLDGKTVGAGTARVARGPGAEVVVYSPEFEAGLLGLKCGPSESIRYAIPSSWRVPPRGRRHGHRVG